MSEKFPFPVTKQFFQAVNTQDSPLGKECLQDAFKFWQECQKHNSSFRESPDLLPGGFNLEKLKSGSKANLWSIRVSKNPRIILAEYEDCWLFANAGRHDPMYKWAERKRYYVGPDEVYKFVAQTTSGLDSDLEKALKGDFAEWMLWLYPEQKRYAEMECLGALRIRGGAGTGKSVIGLHRAAVLARRYPEGNILVTAFHKSAVNNLKRLYSQMPNPPENVRFNNMDSIAREHASLYRKSINSGVVNDLFYESWKQVRMAPWEQRLDSLDGYSAVDSYARVTLQIYGANYIREEIERVIVGRDVTKDEYLNTESFERVGRKATLKKQAREKIWELYAIWEEKMKKRGVTSFPQLRLIAMKSREEESSASYRCVIVDEAQDLTPVEMRLLRTLVAGKPENPIPPDGLVLLDDAAQQIYPGGYRYSWSELGMKKLRTEIPLPGNYRNSRAIFHAAQKVRGTELLVKENNEDKQASFPESVREEGEKPVFLITEKGRESVAILECVNELKKQGFALREIGILLRKNADMDRLKKYLEKKGVECRNIRQEEQDDSCVSITTFDSVKGLEFRAVIIPRMGRSEFPIEGSLETEREILQLELDRLYVAMTRPTERLYLIADENPCEAIMNAQDAFEGDLWQPQT